MINRAQDINTSDNLQKNGLVLFDNVQFIFELALAQLELQALNINFQVTNGLREFKPLTRKNLDVLARKTAYFYEY